LPIFKDGIAILSLQDWETHAGPKRSIQWKDGRSAKEAARAWLDGDGKNLPTEVTAALTTHKSFGTVQDWRAEPEVKLRFDGFAGEPRNSDLVVYAQDSNGPLLIAVEAKADEPFGETVANTKAAALARYSKNNRSNGLIRIEQLTKALLGLHQPGEPPDDEIRYQLLTACAGALCEAERHGYSRALVLVHEFITEKTTDDKLRRNTEDLDTFVNRLSHGVVSTVQSSRIYGPFIVPGIPLLFGKVDLFIGKVSRNLRASGG
jgi:hypothetical protein